MVLSALQVVVVAAGWRTLAYRGMGLGRDSPTVLAIAAGWALWLGENDEAVALDYLEGSFGRVDPARWSADWQFLPLIRNSPLLAPLRNDPRWDTLWDPWHEHGRM